jgi:hypothetical protein
MKRISPIPTTKADLISYENLHIFLSNMISKIPNQNYFLLWFPR